MTFVQKVYDFPIIPVEKQLFYVPGLAVAGGYTIGGVRIQSAEPGGFGMLQIQPSLQVNEWDFPFSSWLMSKTNGEILRVLLANTPQICGAQYVSSDVPWNNDQPFSDDTFWTNQLSPKFISPSQVGSTTVFIDALSLGNMLQPGHVIGHMNSTYLVDEISYSGTVATVNIKPPLRNNIATGDKTLLRPYFTGQISNATDVIELYDATNNGAIQIPTLTLSEVIV